MASDCSYNTVFGRISCFSRTLHVNEMKVTAEHGFCEAEAVAKTVLFVCP